MVYKGATIRLCVQRVTTTRAKAGDERTETWRERKGSSSPGAGPGEGYADEHTEVCLDRVVFETTSASVVFDGSSYVC